MKLLRNAQVRNHLMIYCFLSAGAAALGFFLRREAGLLICVLGTAYILLYLLDMRKRYRHMEQFAAGVDAVLHGEDNMCFSDYQEGELSLLKNEVVKLTVRLREQAEQLKKDKVLLADSIADISHQIRTPLTALNLLMVSMRSPELTQEARRVKLMEMGQLLGRIEWQISALLKIAKLDAGTVEFEKEQISLERLVKAAAEPLLISMELREQELVLDLTGDFCGDFMWTAEAVGNILKNCTEHVPAGGRIMVTARENALYSEILISDTGSGFREEDLPHLFERFYKGKNAGSQSIGIGLALARMIITRQNGIIKAENGKNGGALFAVKFYKSII